MHIISTNPLVTIAVFDDRLPHNGLDVLRHFGIVVVAEFITSPEEADTKSWYDDNGDLEVAYLVTTS